MRLKLFKTDIYPFPDFFMSRNEEYSEKTLEKARKRVLDLRLRKDSYCLSIYNCYKLLIVYEYGKIVEGSLVPEKTIYKNSAKDSQNRTFRTYKESLK